MKLRYVLFPSVHYGCRTPNEKIFLYSHNIISIDIFLSFVVTFFYDNHCFGWKPKRSLLNPQKSLVSPSKEIETIKLPVKDPKSPRGIAIETFEIIHPHRILAFLFNDVGIRISKADVKAYWEHSRARGEPWAIQSPASSEHIPLGIHGDSARLWTVYKFEKVLGLFINLVHFRPRSVRHSRWLFPEHRLLIRINCFDFRGWENQLSFLIFQGQKSNKKNILFKTKNQLENQKKHQKKSKETTKKNQKKHPKKQLVFPIF